MTSDATNDATNDATSHATSDATATDADMMAAARATPTITVVTETYNLVNGQGFAHLEQVLATAVAAVAGVGGGPHEVMLIDASDDPRVAQLVAGTPMPAPHALRHVHVPVATGYDTVKDLAAELATGEVVVFLDGDCVPEAPPADWLRAVVDALVESGAPAVTGTTLYHGDSPLSLAASVLDFGFALDDPGGEVGCYTSNNSAFVRAVRAGDRVECDGLRCACYLHAQRLARAGTPVVHAASPAAVVRHERPPFLDERLRRGHDAVAVARLGPGTWEATIFTGGRMHDATVGVARFLRQQWRLDRRRCGRVCERAGVSRRTARAALALIPLLRAVEVLGMWRAILLPPDRRWQPTVTLDEAREHALARRP